ncbi:MAG: ferritin family protein [Candidatus Omnitrophica bacterium]|nr:ferritin family protein [Candidatus Omnitrophota bacterium]MCM8801766.1 ferritin family protein [Candidatus Omnitrophota bacterium]
MVNFFNISEIYQFAIKIEENGEKFYRKVAWKTKDKKVKDLFIFLADEEVRHKRIFEENLKKIEKYEPSESYPGEYFAYLRAYAEGLIFTKNIEKELEKEDILEAIDFGIRRELDSIMYYLEMKDFIPETQELEIDKIIKEERSHFIKLSNLKKQILEGR